MFERAAQAYQNSLARAATAAERIARLADCRFRGTTSNIDGCCGSRQVCECSHKGKAVDLSECEECGALPAEVEDANMAATPPKGLRWKFHAAATRAQHAASDAAPEEVPPLIEGRRKVVLYIPQPPGDVTVLSAAVRDLDLAHPEQFAVAVECDHPELWAHNPHVVPGSSDDDSFQFVRMHYPAIHESNQRPRHFVEAFHEYLAGELGVPIPITRFHGDIHLSDEERSQDARRIDGPYWVLMAGVKQDFPAKLWPTEYYQQVVSELSGRVQFVQVGLDAADCANPRLEGVLDLVGKTTLRELARLIYHAQGVLCPITLGMHLAAAVPHPDGDDVLRPCVVIAGGREPAQWTQYPGHQFLHTIGALPCCKHGGCWRSHLDAERAAPDKPCERVVQVDGQPVAECLAMIQPQDVIRAVERYLH